MTHAFRLQDPGEGIHEVAINEVCVSKGDRVEEGQIVLVVESDKAAVEIPAPVSGEIVKLPVSKGDTIEVGELLMTFETDEASEPKEVSETKEPAEKNEKPKQDKNKGKTEEKATKEDNAPQNGKAGTEGDTSDKAAEKMSDRAVKASPAARREADAKGVDLKGIEGTGSHGHITKQDIKKAAGQNGKQQKKGDETETAGTDEDKKGDQRKHMSTTRQAIAQHMAQAWSEIPHVSHQDLVDITDLEEGRRAFVDTLDEETARPTLTAYLLKALGIALRQHPEFNATVDMDAKELVLKKGCHIAFALDTDRGLLAPVIRNVDRKTIPELAAEAKKLAEKMKDGPGDKADLAGGTFTLTNVGTLGGTGFTPIINHPQVAIMGAAAARLEQVVTGTRDNPDIRVRLMLPLVLAFDHRVLDGADAARFMNTMKDLLSSPQKFLAELS